MPDRGHDLLDLFVRDLDQIELPPHGLRRPAPRKETLLVKTSRYVLYAGVVAAVLVAALIVGLGTRDRAVQVATTPSPIAATSTPIPASSPPATPSPAATASAAQTQTPQLGAITGRFAYGSDFIPPVTVYAISTADARVWYSVGFVGLGRGRSATPAPGTTEPGHYLISGIAPGTYWVVAYRTDGELPDPGYHSPRVNPVPITVTSGQTATGIDIVTWGTQPPPSPTLPPRPTPRP